MFYSVGGGGAGSCTLQCGRGRLRDRLRYITAWGGNRLMCSTVWRATQVLYNMGGAGSGTLPLGRSRLLYFTVCEEPALVLYRLGGAGSCTLPCGRSRLLYFTVWEEPALVLYRLGGTGSGTVPLWEEPTPVIHRVR